MQGTANFPAIPWLIDRALGTLPIWPLQAALNRTAVRITKANPSIFERLDGYRGKVFLIDPTDLSLVFRVDIHKPFPVVTPLRRGSVVKWDARIAAPFWSHVAMLHGKLDADALFFSGDLMIEGDVEAALALRNALDDSDIDLLVDAFAALTPSIAPLRALGRDTAAMLSRLTKLPLTRLP